MYKNLEPRIEYNVRVWNSKTDCFDIAHHGVFNPESTPKWVFYKNVEETDKFDEDWHLAGVLPYEEFGLEISEGWHDLIQPILDYVSLYNVGKPYREQMIIEQIKSKFGTLRVYINNKDEKIKELINIAEQEAYETCEICGNKHDIGMVTNGWITTLCRNCFRNYKPGRIWRSYLDKSLWTIGQNKEIIPYIRS